MHRWGLYVIVLDMAGGRPWSWLVIGGLALLLTLRLPPGRVDACTVREHSPQSAFRDAYAVLLFEIVGVENVPDGDMGGQTLTVRILRVFKYEGRRLRSGDVVEVMWFNCNSSFYSQSDVGQRELRAFSRNPENRLEFAWYSASWSERRPPGYLRRSARRYRSSE